MTKQIVPAFVILTILAALGWYIDSVAHNDIVWTIRAGLYAFIVALALTLTGFTAVSVLLFRERFLTQQAARKQAQRDASIYVVVSPEHGVFIRDTDKNASWKPAHLIPNQYQNGKPTQPSSIEITTWQTWQALRAPRAAHNIPQQALLPATTEAEQLDLLTVFTQPTQSYAIIGGQQTGKTFQAQHIANYWLRQGIKPAVIGPKWDRGEWAGCYLMGGNGDFQKVEWGISLVRRLVESRHADQVRSHKQHAIQPVFFDDWTPIVDSVSNARALVLEATTLYASVNVILYFILHSDTANAWGVDRKGAALKDNFIKLFIVPQYDGQGQIVRHLTRGYIRFAGESVDRPVKLFSIPPVQIGRAVELRANPAGPDEVEAQIIHLHDQGEPVSSIAALIYGSKGGPQNKKVQAVLDKFGKV